MEHAVEAEVRGEPFVDVFSAQFIQDVDGDGFSDVLAAHTQDMPPGLTGVCVHAGLRVVVSRH
jgi:hypothetical protein